MQIPKTIKLAGLTITVEQDPELHGSRGILGEARYVEQKILLDSKVLHPQLQEQNYLHELVHWILYVMARDELRNDEIFVECFAFLLHQALVTGEYHG